MAQVKPNKMMNKMNGDNLTQMKYLKKAEVSSRVISFNMASKAQLLKKVRWSFREQRLNVDKINKGQTMVYRDWCRLQQNKRKLLKEAHLYRQDDARMEILRLEREEKIDQIMREYDEKSRDMMESLLKKKRRKRKNSVESVGSRRSSNGDVKVLQDIELPEDSNAENAESKKSEDSSDNLKNGAVNESNVSATSDDKVNVVSGDTNDVENRTASERRRKSKTLQVSVNAPKLLIREESDEDLKIRKSQTEKSEENFVKLPPIPQRIEEESSIEEVTRANLRLSPAKNRQRLPSIFENCIPEEAEIPETKSSEENNMKSPLQSSRSSQSEKNKMSNKDYIKFLQKKREADNRKILDEPYEIYTEDERGRIVPMISPPKPFTTTVPSNKFKYERNKILEAQYRHNALNGLRLKGFFASLEKPDSPDDFPMLTKAREPTATDLTKNLKAGAKLNPLTSLVPTQYMETGETPAYVRQLDFDEMREARKRGRRSSSWAHVL